jgi:uncharacterized protein GlcG (DUF336 family)
MTFFHVSRKAWNKTKLPITGGVGVSGAPSGEQDEKCAKAGIDAVRFELETF